MMIVLFSVKESAIKNKIKRLQSRGEQTQNLASFWYNLLVILPGWRNVKLTVDEKTK
jgi:hypothetical protein